MSNLIKKVLLEELNVAEACKNFPKNEDKSIQTAFHALVHFEADEDLRKRDSRYKDEQDDYLLYLSQILENGEALPVNIIVKYLKYYEKAPIYPKINKKSIFETLKRFINI